MRISLNNNLNGVFQPYIFWSGLGEFLGVIFYWKNVYLKHTYTVLDTATTTTTPSCHHKEAKLQVRKPNRAMENARMKSGCLPGNLLDGLRNGESF